MPLQLDTQRVDGGNLFTVTGRLLPGITVSAANGQLAMAAANARRDAPRTVSTRTVWTVEPLHDAMVGSVRTSLNLLLAAVGLLTALRQE